MTLTFVTTRAGKFTTSDVAAFRRLIKESLAGSYNDRFDLVHDHFDDIRLTQAELHHAEGIQVLITLTPGTIASRELMPWIASTMEERFLFQGSDVRLVRR
jgi:hypothetical protein